MGHSSPLPHLSIPLIFPLILLLLHISASWAAPDPVYTSFVQCFSARTKQPSLISQIVYAQNNPSYTSVLRAYIRNARFNTTSTPKPVIIVTPTQESHVQASVLCSKQSGIRIRIRSGGHDYEGVSYVSQEPYIILDMFNLRSVAVDMKEQTAWVQAGATIGELYYRISEKSKVHGFPSAVCPTVGVGGNLCGGGYGFMLRKYGTTADNILDAKMVDVNGRILDRNSMGEDLFWGIRGGGGGASFGVILAYKINLVVVLPKVTVFRVERTLEESATDIVSRWQHVAPNTDENPFMRMLIQPVTSQ